MERKPVVTDEMLDALAKMPPLSEVQKDLLIHGFHVTKAGKRIDPMDLFPDPPPHTA